MSINFKARSIDINLGGIYATLDQDVPCFSQMEVSLNVPIDGRMHPVKLEAVVVRCEPSSSIPGSFDAALAYDYIPPETEDLLCRYLVASADPATLERA